MKLGTRGLVTTTAGGLSVVPESEPLVRLPNTLEGMMGLIIPAVLLNRTAVAMGIEGGSGEGEDEEGEAGWVFETSWPSASQWTSRWGSRVETRLLAPR